MRDKLFAEIIFIFFIIGFVSASNTFLDLKVNDVEYIVEFISSTDETATIKIEDSFGNTSTMELYEQKNLPFNLKNISDLYFVLKNSEERPISPQLEMSLWIGPKINLNLLESTINFSFEGEEYTLKLIGATDSEATIELNGVLKELNDEQPFSLPITLYPEEVENLYFILVNTNEMPISPFMEVTIVPFYEKNFSISYEIEEEFNCTENWSCSSWEDCLGRIRVRNCSDLNDCGTFINKPYENESCGDENLEQNQTEISQQNQTQKQKNQNNESQDSYYIKSEKVTINKKGNKFNLFIDGKEVESFLDLVNESGKVYVKTINNGKKEIKILPAEAISNANKISSISGIKIVGEKDSVVYSVSGTKRVFLFFVFPLEVDIEQSIDIEDGSLISTKKPWWHFLAFGI